GRKRSVTFAAFREIPWNIFGTPAAGRSQVDVRTPYLDNELVALAYRIPESLRKSPTPALNLIKESSPALGRIPTDMGRVAEAGGVAETFRRLFAKATFKLDYYNNEGLPHWLSPFSSLFR